MREIKFRQARCGAKDNFVDWFYWGFIDDGSGLHFVAPLQHNVPNYQFTGLKDKNGKEIYEGDIVKSANRTGYIRYRADICSMEFEIKALTGDAWYDNMGGKWSCDELEIIGNILHSANQS